MPVCSLQKVGCQNPSLCTSRIICEQNHFLRVSKLNQALQTFNLVSQLNVQVGGQFKATLFSALLSYGFHKLDSFGFFYRTCGLFIREHFLDQLLLDGHVVLNADI